MKTNIKIYINSTEYKRRKAANLIEMKEELEKRKPTTVFGFISTLNSISGKERIESRTRILTRIK